jgi:HD-like signal output (HDOD) protein
MPITVPGDSTVINESMVRAQADRNPVLIIQSLQVEYANYFADVPVLPETLLLIDLEMQGPSVDLGRLTQLILGDLGATIQILQLANHRHNDADGCWLRVEDLISDLDLDTCVEVLSERVVCHDSRHKAILELWTHSREIAHWCRIIAEEVQDPHPNDAYLLGLFHAVGSLPATLGWGDSRGRQTDNAVVGVELVKRWPLPHCVAELLQAQIAGLQAKQLDLVQRAHQRVSRSSDCAFCKRVRRQFLYTV